MADVQLAVPPGYGRLGIWGHGNNGWYGLIHWIEQTHDNRGTAGFHRGSLQCSGWVAAEHIKQIAGLDYRGIPRIGNLDEMQLWPANPPVRTSGMDRYHYGLLVGQAVEPPDHVQWLNY